MDNHLTAPVRSRNSQSSSPSHSASASATSFVHKRKLNSDDHAPPFPSSLSDTRDGALTSNDDLESISARGADSDSDDESEEVVDDDEEYDDTSMRNFTASRLEKSLAPSSRNSKLKTESSVKIEPSDVSKDTGGGSAGGNASTPGATGSAPGIVVKEDVVKNIFTDNIQAREESLKREEREGRLKFASASNDGIDEHMKFGEIAFCAITTDEQVKGYGTRRMNHLNQHARDVDGLTHFLTYADNNAVGYFVKQGFRKEIHLEKEQWHGRKEAGIPKKAIKVEDIPGLNLKTINVKTSRVREQYYVTFEMFVADAKRMFGNARTYNSPETIYYKCSTRLEAHFSNKVQANCCLGVHIRPFVRAIWAYRDLLDVEGQFNSLAPIY